MAPDTRLDRLLARAAEIDPVNGASMRLKPRLDSLLAISVAGWIDWGERDIEPIRTATTNHVAIAQEFAKINPSKLTDECREASTRPPGFMDRFAAQSKADFFQQRLEGVRREVASLLGRVQALKNQISPRFETLRLDVIALKVAAEELTDPIQITIAANRLSTLVSGQQSAEMLMQSLSNSEGLIVTATGTIDHLLNDVIPNWKMSQAHRP